MSNYYIPYDDKQHFYTKRNGNCGNNLSNRFTFKFLSCDNFDINVCSTRSS